MTKYKGSKGHGNGYHDSAVYKNKKMNAFMGRVREAQNRDVEKAKANNMVLVVDYTIERIGIYQACLFCYKTEMVKIKEDHYKCPKCSFQKIKEGVQI